MLYTGWDAPSPESLESEEITESVIKSVTSMHSLADKKRSEWHRGLTLKQTRARDTLQGSNTAPQPKLVQTTSGPAGYVSAMKKATRCVGGEVPSVSNMPDEFRQANTQAVKFLDLLKVQPTKRTTETPAMRASRMGPAASDVLAQWTSRGDRQNEQAEGLQRSWPVLAGPAFCPQQWFQGSSDHKIEVAEDAKQAAEKAASQGPDVSAFPRPSDRLAFAHLEESGAPSTTLLLRPS